MQESGATFRSPKSVRFGVFEVDFLTGELRKRGIKIKLQEKPFQILTALLERPGEVVSRDELRSRVWGDHTFVDFERGLNIAVARLRAALGDSADSPRFVETLARRGYRFISQVEGVEGARVPEEQAKGLAIDKNGRTLLQRVWFVLAGAAVLAVMSVAIYLYWHLRKTLRLTEQDTIILADFNNTTGDAVFDDALRQALSVQLDQTPFLNALSDRRLRQELSYMRRSQEARITE